MSANWENDWISIDKAAKGNQGQGYVVTRRSGDGTRFFLKELTDNHNSERRARFFREVNCYRTLTHPRIPKFVATNGDSYLDRSVPLYVVTEFVDGPTLHQYLQKRGMPSSADALGITSHLLDVLAYAHERKVVHRDIKPDNVILRDSSPADPVLVDWGMAYLEIPGAETLTDAGTQIGNQFFRLPEHAPGSGEKREEASDLTQLTGLLFLLLSGNTPRQLLNAESRKPHERRIERLALEERTDLNLPWILRVFDHAFELAISKRFQTAEQLKTALVQPVVPKNAGATTQDMIQGINAHLKSPKGQQKAEDQVVLDRLGRIIYDAAGPLQGMLPGISIGVGGFTTETTERQTNVNFHLNPHGDDSLRFTASIHGKVIGHDLTVEIVQPYQDELLRFPREELTAKEAAVGNAVRDVLIRGLHDTVSGDGVVRRRYFKGVVYDNLEDAQAAAIRDQRPIFLIVFDSTKPKNSEIEYALGYFMQRQSTKDEVARHFIQAIVDVHRLSDRNLVPEGATLESCLWLVLDPKGRRRMAEGVHANPDEGAKRVHAAVEIIPQLLAEPSPPTN